MKITKVKIKNFRAFEDVTIDFSDFNCIIGKNDCGKSTVFAALDWFFNDKGLEDRLDINVKANNGDDIEVKVSITFDNQIIITKQVTIERTIENVQGILKQTIILNEHGKTDSFSMNEWSYFLKYKSPFNLPKFEIFSPVTPLKQYLNILFNNSIKGEVQEKIQFKLDKIQEKLNINPNKTDNKIGDFDIDLNCDFFPDANIPLYTSEGAKQIHFRNRGDGFKQEIKNAVFRVLADETEFNEYLSNELIKRGEEKMGLKRNHSTSMIFAFEEPETHLHPSSQREMFNTIKSLSAKYQVLMTTHSPYIVKALKEEDMKKHKIIILKRIAKKHKTTVKNLPKRVLPYVSMNEINYIAFDEPSIEYHIELFGYIHNKLIEKSIRRDATGISKVDIWLKEDKHIPCDKEYYDTRYLKYIGENDSEHKQPETRTLPFCVRNWIDHPMTKRTEEKSDDDKKYNEAYNKNQKYGSDNSLRNSIRIMREVIKKNPDIFSSRL